MIRGIEPGALGMLGKCSAPELHPKPGCLYYKLRLSLYQGDMYYMSFAEQNKTQ